MKKDGNLWNRYRVEWEFFTRLCASVPADPALITAWLEAREPRVKPPHARSIAEINAEVLDSLERGEGEPDTSYSLLVFQRNGGICSQRHATVKAHLKDCGTVLSNQYMGREKGERAFSTRVKNGLYTDPSQYWIPITRPDGTPVTQGDGFFDKAIHVRGPRGEPLNALKRFEYIDPPAVMRFSLLVLGNSVHVDDLHSLFQYGGIHGYAGERSDGEGRYTYRIESADAGTIDAAALSATAAHGRSRR